MSLNCKLSCINGNTCSSLRLKKSGECLHGPISGSRWRREFLVFWLLLLAFGFVWFILIFKHGSLINLETTAESSEEKTHILLANFSASKDEFNDLASFFFESNQITSLTCRKESGSGKLHKFSIICVLRAPRSSNHIAEKPRESIIDQCPVQEEHFPINHDPSPIEDKSSSCYPLRTPSPLPADHLHCAENMLQRGALETDARDNCWSVSFCFIRMHWWILIAVAVSCKIAALCKTFWRYQKKKLAKLQPQAEKPQLLQQLQQQHAQISSRSTGNWRKKLLVCFVLSGMIGSMWLFWYMNEDISLRRKEVLVSMCDERARMLQDQFNVSMNHVHALAILVSAFHHEKHPSAIDQKTFEEYTERTAFERPLTSGVAYALRVRHSEREQFEKLHGWKIKKMETEDQTLAQDSNPEKLDSSPVQDEYAPVIFSQKTISHIVSIDMMSGKEDRENILRARASGKGVLTSPIKLLKSNHLGVVLTFAVYDTNLSVSPTPEQRINATVGYIGAPYDVPSQVEKLLSQLASKHTIVVSVYDTTNGSAPIKMYGTNATDTGLLYISPLDFGDPARKHEMHCRFKQKPPPPWTAIMASGAVLVITLLVGHIFHGAINRIAQVESDYRGMMELKHRAEAADIAKSQFLATVSHEIRTPMNGVLGMLQMLMDTNLDATQMDYAETAHSSGRELISLINEVLDQAKIESGRLELEAVSFDLRALLDKVVSIFSSKSHEKGVELAVYVSERVPEEVVGDPGRLKQIITNLVGNSIKFTDDKGHIFVSVHLADEVTDLVHVRDEVLRKSLSFVDDHPNDSYRTLSGYPVVDRWRSWEKFKNLHGAADEDGKIKLLLTVEDTGVGIPFEAQDRIFMPFMQADSSTSRTYGGTGIGLSISKRLVDLMGGEIGFVSECGIGSTFSFTAIFKKPEETRSLEKNQQPTAISEFLGLRALVVDEKSVRAEVTRYHLRRLGMHVNIASTMSSACSQISSSSKTSEIQRLSLVLIDKDSWAKEGHTFYTRLKEIRNTSMDIFGIPTKIILSAACISSTEREELKSTGLVDNFLAKPLRLNVLISCFQEATGFGKKQQVTVDRPPPLGNLLRGKQILVVDDNVVNRRVAEGALRKYGAIVTCVVSGKAAKEMLTPPHKFDACFMDLQMPEMDGFEATKQIRSLESKYNEKINFGEISVGISTNVAHWHTPILAMTADVIQATDETCMKYQMDGYVSKPFEEGQLYSAVARFFVSGCEVQD